METSCSPRTPWTTAASTTCSTRGTHPLSASPTTCVTPRAASRWRRASTRRARRSGPRAEEEADADILDGDVGGEVGGPRSGRLLAPDEGSHEDVDSELVAEDEGIDGAGASAEEAAMHTIEDE